MIKKFHILALTPMQQAALRYCLYNSIQKIFINCLSINESEINDVGSKMLDYFRQYDEICSLMAPFQGNEEFKGKKRLLTFEPNFFKFVIKSANDFNESTARLVLGKVTSKKIMVEMEPLLDLIEISMKHIYTSEELKIAAKIMK